MTLTNDALAQICPSLRGKAFDRKSLELLIAECKRLAGQGSNLMVTAERRLPLAGVSLNVGPGDHQAGMPGFSFGQTGAGDQALVIAMLRADGLDGLDTHAQWPVQMVVAPSPDATNAGPAKVADDDLLPGQLAGMGDYFKRQEEEFWSDVDKLFEPARDACQPYTCILSVQRSNPMEEE
jgi:hypothetical protein